MSKKRDGYEVYTFDRLDPGRILEIKHRVTVEQDSFMQALVDKGKPELEIEQKISIANEEEVLAKLKEATEEWEKYAAQTQRIDRALKYLDQNVVEHTANEWVISESKCEGEISNMVYEMFYNVYEQTKYDRAREQSVTIAWYLTWDVSTNIALNPPSYSYWQNSHLAGQSRKRFTDKTALDKYLSGRIKAYSHLFCEISPAIPKELINQFSVNGLLLPGYTVEVKDEAKAS